MGVNGPIGIAGAGRVAQALGRLLLVHRIANQGA